VFVEDHELVREAATHDAHVRADRDRVEAQPSEDPLVGLVVEAVRAVEPRLVGVDRVRVLHHELADADQPTARAGLVAELRLEVVHDEGQLPVALQQVPQEAGDDLFMCECQDHVPSPAVLETQQLRPDLRVAAALPP
jgi:hypothetical protein